MSKHPKKLIRVPLKEELVALTGDFIKALILQQFLYWSERVGDFDDFIEEEKLRNPEAEIELRHGWIYKSAKELHQELMFGKSLSPATARRRVEELVKAGFLSERNNPKNNWDRMLQYRPNIIFIQIELQKTGYALDGYPLLLTDNAFFTVKNACDTVKNQSDAVKNDILHGEEAIPEITLETTTNIKESSAKINFGLPPYPHSSLSGEVVFFQESDTLHRAIVTRVMGKTLNLTLTESGAKKRYVRPAGAVFYQNGSEELSPVEVGAAEKEKKLSDGETTVMNAIIDLMPEPGFIAEAPYKRAKRMGEIFESARKAHASGIQAGEFTAFGIWHQDVSWAGRDSPPPITLETIRKNWAQFQTYRGGKNGQVGQGNPEGQSGVSSQTGGTTSDQTAAYINQNRDNLQRKIERLTR